ncbi:hypothetical protein Ahia01_001255000, partial [Argonauta hians]
MENFIEWLPPSSNILQTPADPHIFDLHYGYSPAQQVLSLDSTEDCDSMNYSKFEDNQTQIFPLNFEDLISKAMSYCPVPKSCSSSMLGSNEQSSANNSSNNDGNNTLFNEINHNDNDSCFQMSDKQINNTNFVFANKKDFQQSGNIQYQNLNKCSPENPPLESTNINPRDVISKGKPHIMPSASFPNTSERLTKCSQARVTYSKPNMLHPSSHLSYSDRINSKKSSFKNYSTRKLPVSIKARNAKFLCTEKDLRSWTVRELLETCETIQENSANKEETPDKEMEETNSKNASNINQTEESYVEDFNESDNSEFCEENPKHFNEILHGNGLHLEISTTYPEINPVHNIFLNPQNNPERLQTFKDYGHVPSIPIKVYQPTFDFYKFVKSKCANDKKIPRPKHFDFNFLQIRNFKYFCNNGNFKRISKIKILFSKKKLVYEFQVGETANSCGGYTKHLAIIEIDFSTIVALWGQEDKFRLQVKVPPQMYVGTYFNSCHTQQRSSAQNFQYDRSHTIDLTCGELYQVPFHYIQLSTSVNKILACLSEFSPQFELMLQCPFIETFPKIIPSYPPPPPLYPSSKYHQQQQQQ